VIHKCKTPLANNQHRFCPKHSAQNFICAIIGCDSPVIPDSCTCSDPQHQDVEQIHQATEQAQFQLWECLQCAQVAHSNDAVTEERNPRDVDAETEEFDVNGPPESNQKKRIRAQFISKPWEML
jgi:hypothetical protein